MNVVVDENGRPMTAKELIYALGMDTNRYFHVITESDMFVRLEGNHCDCCGDGVFTLLPVEECLSGGKRYMQCKKCGGYSHL